MALYTFKLPDVGEGIAESEIATWRVKVGDAIAEDQPLVDMLTDKAAIEIPSPVSGKVIEFKGREGDKIAVGGALVIIETSADAAVSIPSPTSGEAGSMLPAGGGKAAAMAPVAAAAPVSAPAPVAIPAAAPTLYTDKPLAAPSIRKKARELGIDLCTVKPTHPSGRITPEDFAAHIEAMKAPAAAPAAARGPAVADDSVEEVRVIGLRRKIAEAMQRTKQRIPHFAYVEEVDVTELEALRNHLNDTRRKDQPKLTLLPFLLKAIERVLPEFPLVNANFDDEAGIVRRYKALHAGIATMTPQGLVVPVVRHAQMLDVWGLAAEIKRLAEAARAGKAKREELSGSSITVTSLGAMGGIVSKPIINAPEVAIVGVNKLLERPMYRNGMLVPRLMMNLSSSFDHRVVDGYDAASFIQAVKAKLEHPATLFMP